MGKQGLKLGFPGMGKKGQDAIGVEVGEDFLKIAHARTSQLRREILHFSHQPIHGLKDEEISALIKKAVAGMGFRSAPRVFVAAPLNSVITRTIEIPSRDPAEIREIVSLQASRHTPYSRSEIIIDLVILGVVRESYTKVLLVIVPKDAVARQILLCEAAGLAVEKVLFGPEGLCQACSKILGIEHSDKVTAIVHVDSGFTTFQVVQRNRVIFLRGISIGSAHLIEEKDLYQERFIDELEKSLETYMADELGAMPETLLLTGVVGDYTGLDDLFQDALHIPIKHQTYYNYFAMSVAARKSAETHAREVSFFSIAAPLLLFDRLSVDLTSDERKLKIQLEQRGRQMVTTGFLVMTLLALIAALFTSKIYFRGAYLQKLDARYGPVIEEAEKLERTYTKLQAVKGYLAARGESLEVLTQLYESIPDDVRLTNIRYEEGQRFSVKGTSAAMASVFAFVTDLERSDRFKTVKTKYVTNRSENGLDVADFEITAAIEVGRAVR